ncbi:kinetoplast-associated protein KAP [Paramyrothecium foliicola]|nr:kinetoplast-associated protein KAP [Paramyrothecium foliicola]
MSGSLIQPAAHLSSAEALQLAQQAPTILRSNPKAISSSPLSFLFSATENAELWTIYENLLLTCLRTGDDDAAHQCLERLVLRFGDSNERVMALKGLVKEAQASNHSELEKVLKEYDAILKEDATNIPIAKRKVALLRSMGRLPEATNALTSLLDASPIDAEAWAELSDLCLAQGQYVQAIFSLEEVLVLSPNAWNIHARLGEVLLMAAQSNEGSSLKHFAEAVKRFSRSIELCDDYLRGYYGLKLATDRLLSDPAKLKKQQTDLKEFTLPSQATLEKLNETATKKLGEIVRRYGAQERFWQGYDADEIAAARELLAKSSTEVVRPQSPLGPKWETLSAADWTTRREDGPERTDEGGDDASALYNTGPSTVIAQQPGASSQSTYYSEEESSRLSSYSEEWDERLDDDDDDEEEDDDEDDDEVDPSDSASAIHERPVGRTHAIPPHVNHRHHRVPHQQAQYQQAVQGHAPTLPSTVDNPEEFGHFGRGYQAHAGAHPGYHPSRGGHGHGPAYHQNHPHAYMAGGYPGQNQMVPYGYGGNPFSPMSNGSSGTSYFGGEGRGMYDMMPYHQQGFYGGPAYNMGGHMQPYITPPPPPPTEPPAKPATPAPKEPPPPDPEKLRLEAELAAFKAKQEEAKAAALQAEREAQIRKDAEDAFQRRMEDLRRAQEEAKIEIEKAKAEAERAARERIEAERKAEEERARQHAEAMQRAEEKARMKFEADLKEAEERRKREEEARARAEEAARLRLEEAYRKEAEAKAEAERKAAEEAERLKIQLEMAIRKEAEAKAEAAKKAAEEAEKLKQIAEDAKKQAEADALAKVEADKKAAAAAAEAEAKAKADADELKKKIEDEAREKYDQDKKKAEKAPIKFKDAVGRKFSFPFHLCATWQGMEELIKQAFLQVDVLGPHVQEGHYDLIGPNGEIILPSVWEKVVEPDWQITMTMWPMEKTPPIAGRPPPGARHGHGHGHGPMPPPFARPGQRPGPGMMGGVPPPPDWPGRPGVKPGGAPNVVTVTKPSKSSSKKKPTMLDFLSGKPTKKKSGKK